MDGIPARMVQLGLGGHHYEGDLPTVKGHHTLYGCPGRVGGHHEDGLLTVEGHHTDGWLDPAGVTIHITHNISTVRTLLIQCWFSLKF